MVLPLWSKCNVPVPLNPDPVTPIWWNPGVYIKWNDTQLMNQYTTVKNEIALSSMDALQGVKFAILWGRYETNSTTRDFSQIGGILDDFAAMTPQRRLILSISQREFKSDTNGVSLLLPGDMQTQEGLYDWNGTNVREYKYAWPYIKALSAGSYGHNLKLWSSTDGTTVRNRLKAFITALVAYINSHPNGHLVEHLSETESVIGNPVVPNFSTVEPSSSRGTQTFTNKAELSNYANAAMIGINKYYMQGLNFINSFVNTQAPQLPGLKMGLSTPDHHAGTNIATVMKYFKTGVSSLDGQIPLAAECQADSFDSSGGPNAAKDYPTPLWLYNRAITIGNTHFVIQRITAGEDYDFWNTGAPGNGGMLDFLQNNTTIQTDPLRAGGMVSALPSSLALL